MENKTLPLHSQMSQPQAQAPPIILSGPTINENDLRNVEIRAVRSVSSKRIRSRDPAPVASMPGPIQQHPADPSLPKGTTHEGLALLPSHLSPILNLLRKRQCKLKI